MENRKTIITICSLSALCILVLAGVFFLNREPKKEFVPTASEPESVVDSWEENDTDITDSKNTNEENQTPGTINDDTQVIVSEDESGSTANLSDSQAKEDTSEGKPPEKPVTSDDTTNPDKQPEYDATVPQQKAEDPSNTQGSDSHPGQVYVPGFGWVTPSPVIQDTIDSDGDINKQVGTMGGS